MAKKVGMGTSQNVVQDSRNYIRKDLRCQMTAAIAEIGRKVTT